MKRVFCYSLIRDVINIGDLHCNPGTYFPELQAEKRDLRDYSPSYGLSIFGGGGLLHPNLIDHLIPGPLSVAWGMGCNTHGVGGGSWPKFLDDFRLVGLRDIENPWQYVPCASCMNHLFHKFDGQPKRDYVIYEHFQHPLGLALGPVRKNIGTDLAAVIDFLASARCVITNTYHGAYWSLLLGRQVIVVKPFSNRFYYLHPAIMFWDGTGFPPKLKTASQGKTFLESCVSANWNFLRQVLQLANE